MSILKSSCFEGRGDSSGCGISDGPAEHGAVESRERLYEDPGSATFSFLPVLLRSPGFISPPASLSSVVNLAFHRY